MWTFKELQGDVGTQKLIQKLLSLPYLPAASITEAFYKLKEKCTTPLLSELADNSTTWPTATWSVYLRAVRTNNDCEGWHNRLNVRVQKGNLNMYLLMYLLHAEASLVTIQASLLSDGKVLRHQRKKFLQHQGQLFSLWKQYNSGEKSLTGLVRAVGRKVQVNQ